MPPSEGDMQKTFTLATIVIHFVHPLLCVVNYLDWVRNQEEQLGQRIVNTYLALTILASVMYLMVASVFYMWAYRWPLPEEYARQRRINGVIVNLIFCDIPIFAIEVDIIWTVGVVNGLQGSCFVWTCLSFAYSGFRAWFHFMTQIIKATKPPQQLAGLPTMDGGYGARPAPPQGTLRHRTAADMYSAPSSAGVTSAQIAAAARTSPAPTPTPLPYGNSLPPTGVGAAAGGIVPNTSGPSFGSYG
eukprot:TRINITY_DN17768_c0_g1_i1.p1 TRINITY_DN17768_c0_g1~~TRINITY_DN17768_c0_g1_i1.p1  ORF type:complete len:269 (+),score=35.10 TRINITY_DN17768_c0_g1_i1:73-807(+)